MLSKKTFRDIFIVAAIFILAFIGILHTEKANAGVCSGAFVGGTGICYPTVPILGDVLVGNGSTGYVQTATSSLGITSASSTLYSDNGTFSGNDTFSNSITGSVSGNAGTATVLQTARTINGVSFNGSANITIPIASSTLLSDNNTFSGSNVFNGPTIMLGNASTTDLNGVLNPLGFIGSDICAQANAAYASQSQGVALQFPAGNFSCATRMNMNVSGKAVLLEGAPGNATKITYTGAATSTILNFGGSGYSSLCGIENITLIGNKTGTQDGTVGIQLGGSNGFSGNCTVSGTHIIGFGTGIQTEANAYLYSIENNVIEDNYQDWHTEINNNSGESVYFKANNISDCINVSKCFYSEQNGLTEPVFSGGSFDDAQVWFDAGNLGILFDGTSWENPNQKVVGQYTYLVLPSTGFTQTTMTGDTFAQDATTTAKAPYEYIINGSKLTITGLTVDSFSGTVSPALISNYGSHADVTISGLMQPLTAVTSIATSSLGFTTNTAGDGQPNYTGIATSTPGSLFSINGIANFAPTTSTFYNANTFIGNTDLVSTSTVGLNSINNGAVLNVGTYGIGFPSYNITTAQPALSHLFSGLDFITTTNTEYPLIYGYGGSQDGNDPVFAIANMYFTTGNQAAYDFSSRIAFDVMNDGAVGIGTTTPYGFLSLKPGVLASTTPQFITQVTGSSTPAFIISSANNNGNIGIGTSTPGSILSIASVANFTPATTTFYSTGGINLTAGCITYDGGACIGSNAVTSANPSATIGLTAVNGSASTFMTSDSAPALSQAIIPTWTGLHNFGVGLISDASSTVIGQFTATNIINAGNGLVLKTNSAITNTNNPTLAIGDNWGWNVQGNALHPVQIVGGSLMVGQAAGFPAGVTFPTNDVLVNGSIGIGTTSPQALLTVSDNTANPNTTAFLISSSTASATTTLFSVDNTGSTTIANGVNITAGCFAKNGTCLNFLTADPFWTYANGAISTTTPVSIAASTTIGNGTQGGGLTIAGGATTTGNSYIAGNFGIGSSTPTDPFDLLTTGNFGAVPLINLMVVASTTGGGTGTTSLLTLRSDGTLRVGNSSFPANFAGTTGNLLVQGLFDMASNDEFFPSQGTGIFLNSVGTFNNGIDRPNGQNYMAFIPFTNPAVGSEGYTYFTTAGNWGIGTTTPTAAFAIQANVGMTYPGNNMLLIASSTTGGATTTLAQITNTGATFFPATASSGSAQTGYWCYDANGQLIRDTALCLTSAARFKMNINDITESDALDEALALQPVSYFYKPDFNGSFQSDPNYSGEQVGFIADAVQKVDPRLVDVETSTTTFEGVTYAPGTVQTFRPDAIEAVLDGAIKEQQVEIQQMTDAASTPIRSAEDNWQWIAIGLLGAWNVYLTFRKRK